MIQLMKNTLKNLGVSSLILIAVMYFITYSTNVLAAVQWPECERGKQGYNISNCRNKAIIWKNIGGPLGRPDQVWYDWATSEPKILTAETACGLAPNALSCRQFNAALGSGPALLFDPAASTAAVGANFTISIMVDTFNNESLGTDAYIQYDTTAAQFVQVVNGDFFPSVSHTDQQGTLSIRGMVTEPASFRTGTGKLATVTFKGLKDVVTRFTFICGGTSGASSKIIKNDINASNIIACDANNIFTATIGNATATPTGIAPTGTNATATPTGLVLTGTVTPTSSGTAAPTPCPKDDDDDNDGKKDDDDDDDDNDGKKDDGDDDDDNDGKKDKDDHDRGDDDDDDNDGKKDKDDSDDDNDGKKDHDDDDDDNDGKKDKQDCHNDSNHDDGDDDNDHDDDDKSRLKLMVMLTILLFVMLSVILGI